MNKHLKDKNNATINGVVVLNKYYQRNCSITIPIIFFIIFIGLILFLKFNINTFKWYINIGFFILMLISFIISLYTIIKVFEFTKFFEIHIDETVSALQLLESYQVVEQRGDIFTVIKRTEEMSILEKFKENYIKPNKKFHIKRKEDKIIKSS